MLLEPEELEEALHLVCSEQMISHQSFSFRLESVTTLQVGQNASQRLPGCLRVLLGFLSQEAAISQPPLQMRL